MTDAPKICAFTSICEEDACWLDQYLAEAGRLDMPFVMHFDRCSQETKDRVSSHRLCLGTTQQDDVRQEFEEWHKQAPLDVIQNSRQFDWAMAWDVDETWHRDFRALAGLLRTCGANQVDVPWKNLWDDKDHIRVDGPFSAGHRVKFLTMVHRWRFDSKITNGPKAEGIPDSQFTTEKLPIACIHWGMMTHEMRMQHKERWDRIYTAAVGRNPYGFWNYALDPAYIPTVVKHDLM